MFRDSSAPAQLMISQVKMSDAGVYSCRVDFRSSPTVTTRMRLTVVEEPDDPVILDEEGSSVTGDLGPYR